jgi:hypothetical protein
LNLVIWTLDDLVIAVQIDSHFRDFNHPITRSSNYQIAIVAALLSAVACGETPLGPSSGTSVEALVQDSPASPPAGGTLAGNVSASFWNGDRWVDLGSPNGITIPLQVAGRTTSVHGQTSIPSSSYDRVRLVFQGVTARIPQGTRVGGTVVASDATLALGGSDGRVELIVSVSSFTVAPDRPVRRVVFDLHSARWLTPGALQAGRVEDAAMQAAVTATHHEVS